VPFERSTALVTDGSGGAFVAASISNGGAVAGPRVQHVLASGAEAFAQSTATEARAYRHVASPMQHGIDRIIQLLTAITLAFSALYVGVFPIAVVTGWRLARSRERQRSDVALLTAAVVSIPVSLLLVTLIGQIGGFTTVPLHASFAHIEDMPKNAALTIEGALLLFGANFFGQPLVSIDTLSILVHLAGFGFVLATLRWVVRAWRRGEEPDRLTQVLVVAMGFDVAAHLFSNQAIDLMTSRYLIPFLAFEPEVV